MSTHAQDIETRIETNWSDAADSPRALRAQVRALTAQLADEQREHNITRLQRDRLFEYDTANNRTIKELRDALTKAHEYAAAQQERIEDLEQEVLSAKVLA